MSTFLSFRPTPLQCGVIVVVLASGLALWMFILPRMSSVYKFPGPKPTSFIFGSMGEVFLAESGVLHNKWSEEYGPVFVYQGFLGQMRLCFTDPLALNHVLISRAYDYPKPVAVRSTISSILGNGLLFAEGADHKRQRKLLQPGFSPSHINALVPTFYRYADKLRDKWVGMIEQRESSPEQPAATETYAVIEVSKWLSRATLDIIGKAGFDYDFQALENDDNQLANSFSRILLTSNSREYIFGVFLFMITRYFPFTARIIRNERTKAIKASLATMEHEASILLERKKLAVAAEARGEKLDGCGELEGKDLMSLLVKANMTSEPKGRMSDAEVMGQMTTFILAGHETTSAALSWMLWQLAVRQDVQDRLRAELQVAKKQATERGEKHIPADELQALPCLEAVCRETLRFLAPVPTTVREASVNDAIPLSKPVTLKTGELVDTIQVKRGQQILIPISTFNRSKELFGDDADKFAAERWMGDKSANLGGTGVYAGILTFLAGPRGCIGHRFSLVELKAIIAVLLLTFRFSERDEGGGPEFEKWTSLVMRPREKGKEKGSSMPLRVSLVGEMDA